MSRRILVVFANLALLSIPTVALAQNLPTFPLSVHIAGEEGVTPATVYLACRAPDVLSGAATLGAADRVRKFCNDTRVPRRGTRLNSRELSAWSGVAVPARQDMLDMARAAKKGVEASFANLGKLPVVEWQTGQKILVTGQFDRIREMANIIHAGLQRDSLLRFVVEGRADGNLRGVSPEENLGIAQQRAEAIRSALIGMNIPEHSLLAVGLVEWDEASRAASAAGRQSAVRVTMNDPIRTVASTPRAAPTALGAAGILAGIGQGLVEEARSEFAEYMLRGAGNRICARARAYLTRTCAWFEGAAGRGYLPTVTTLRVALDADLAGVPILWMQDYLLATLPTSAAESMLRRRLGLLYVAHGMERYLAGESLTQVAQGIPEWVSRVTNPAHSVVPADYRPIAAALPEVKWATALSGYLDRLDESQDLLSTYISPEALSPDTVALYALRTVAVTRPETGDRLAQILETARTLVDAAAAADSIRVLLHAGSSADSAGRTLQRARYEAMLGIVGSAMGALFPRDASADAGELGWSRVAQRNSPMLASLLTAASARDHREAMHTVTSLLVELRRNMDDSKVTECLLGIRRSLVLREAQPPRPDCLQADSFDNMPHETFALLGFVTDVASARTEEDVKHSLRGYIRQQGGSRTKRFERGRWYRSLNAYVGLQHLREELERSDSANVSDERVTGAYLPVGFEGGVRLTEGKGRGVTLGVLLQAVDLGAAALYRPKDDNDQVESDLDWRRIIAPGAGLMVGLGEFPFSIGVIGNFAPAARSVQGHGAVDALRWGLIFGFDLPLLQ